MKKLTLIVSAILFISCSDDSIDPVIPDVIIDDEEVVEDNLEENVKEIISMNIQVDEGFLNGFNFGKLYLSNDLGEIVLEEVIENNSNVSLEIEKDANSDIDLTIIKQSSNYIDIDTFQAISSANYKFESPISGQIDDEVKITLLNTGVPWEKIVSLPGFSIFDNLDGGSFELTTNLKNYPGVIYISGLSVDDLHPRYYYSNNIESGSVIEIDYKSLPNVENKVQVEYPSGADITRVELNGFVTNNDIREIEPVDTSRLSNDALVFPNDVFDNYELKALLVYGTTSQKQYEIRQFGIPTNATFILPDLGAQILSAELNDFELKTSAEYSYGSATFSFYKSDINLLVNYEIHSAASPSISFSKNNLLDAILAVNPGLSSANLNFNYLTLTKNSLLENNYSKIIEAIINNKKEYLSGTKIETFKVYE